MIKETLKIIFAIFLLMLPGLSFGFDVPKDAKIKVYDKDGNLIGDMSRKDYKVVKDEPVKRIPLREKERDVKKNSIILHAGAGKNGFNSKPLPSGLQVSEQLRPVLGLSVCRSNKKMGVCASGFSHGTVTLGVKKDF